VAKNKSHVLFLPNLNGSGPPWMDESDRAAFVGLSLENTLGDMIRAVLEGTAFQSRVGIELFKDLKLPISAVCSVGGGAKSPLWTEMRCDIMGKPIETLSYPESGCMGVAMLAAVATGIY